MTRVGGASAACVRCSAAAAGGCRRWGGGPPRGRRGWNARRDGSERGRHVGWRQGGRRRVAWGRVTRRHRGGAPPLGGGGGYWLVCCIRPAPLRRRRRGRRPPVAAVTVAACPRRWAFPPVPAAGRPIHGGAPPAAPPGVGSAPPQPGSVCLPVGGADVSDSARPTRAVGWTGRAPRRRRPLRQRFSSCPVPPDVA